MFESVYTEHLKGRKVLLETPSGFAVFLVKEFVFQEAKNIWVHFSDPEYAIQALVALGFKKIDKSSIAPNCDDGLGKDLVQLIMKFCKTGEELIVQDKDLKASIEKKLEITCICDGYAVGEVMWGIKNVLHEFICEEGCNIRPEYCLPVSKGLQEALQYYLVNIPPRMLDRSFISKFGFLRYLDLNLESFPKELSRSFDEYVGIGETVEDGLDYAKVLALVLVPALVEEHDFPKSFSPSLASKLRQAKQFQAQRGDNLTMHDIEKIMGYLGYLLHVPELRDKILMDVKLMEAERFESHVMQQINQARDDLGLEKIERDIIGKPVNSNNLDFRRVLLETPSGFAIFNVREDVFSYPEHIWAYFSDKIDARNIAFALGFVSVEDKSVTRDSVSGPGDELRHLILRFCKANEELVVQDTALKAAIESKFDVKCRTGEEVVDEVIWGLKYALPAFIPEEREKLTDEYFFPLSKQLVGDLKTYGINVSATEIDANLISVSGYVRILDIILETTYKALRDKCDHYIAGSQVRFIKDDLTYARVVAKALIPEFEQEIDPAEIAGDLGAELIDVPKDAGKVITNYDKIEILQSLRRLVVICKQKKCALQDLNEFLPTKRTVEAQTGVTRIPIGCEDGKLLKIEDVMTGKDDSSFCKTRKKIQDNNPVDKTRQRTKGALQRRRQRR